MPVAISARAPGTVPGARLVRCGSRMCGAMAVPSVGPWRLIPGDRKLGEGSYGSVCKDVNKANQAVRAVKSIAKCQMKNLDRFKQYETFEDHRHIYLVMELCVGGELFDRIIESGHSDEKGAAILMQQIIRAIFCMHVISVCHRDLMPENFLLRCIPSTNTFSWLQQPFRMAP